MKDPRFLSRFGIQVNVSLAERTALGLGGNADFYAETTSAKGLAKLLGEAEANGLKTIVIGEGSSVVFSDFGYRGLVVRNRAKAFAIKQDRVVVGGGATVSELAQQLAGHGYGGLVPFSALPGTIGGAVRGNTVVGSTQFAEVVESVALFSGGRVINVGHQDMRFEPHASRLHHTKEWVIEATLRVRPEPPEALTKALFTAKAQALRRYPTGTSLQVFRNAEGDPVRLLKEAGLTGERVGGASVSSKHLNFIVVAPGTRASEVYELAQRMKHRVSVRLNRKLREQVVWVGEW